MTSYFSVKSNVLRDSGAKTVTTSASAKTEPSAPSKTDPALAQKDGPASFAVKEPVQIDFTALAVRRCARVNPPQPSCKQTSWFPTNWKRDKSCAELNLDSCLPSRCHPWTGDCICKAGWDGQTCSRPCPTYTFGDECSELCTCKNGAFCDPVNGTCLCLSGQEKFFKEGVQ